ncbi:MAG: hypothetical protein HOG03_15620 [Desulfobacula sp.]|uniref:hypothetical protein n=1 Tax=Desulfobacula sp. TaxID=2593537 RepID=UPI001EC8FBE4|nr:hypothetical protein [Desulfobacula sp.]MBT4876619.1 hypothetical protein [Desulfobacula sp.]MBT5546048.1 hypothetical protein [Desulfobacula sp.]MBT5972994.1 hypothetical protein [Desulfobacula sp.]MBT6751040.1 hypothetical protein [Desulfobacula sp.]
MPDAKTTVSFTIGANYAARKTVGFKTSVEIALKYRTTVSSFSTCIIKKTKRNLSGYDLSFRFLDPENDRIVATDISFKRKEPFV